MPRKKVQSDTQEPILFKSQQDLVEYESGESPSSPPNEEAWCGAGSSRVIRVHTAATPAVGKTPRKFKGPTVAGQL